MSHDDDPESFISNADRAREWRRKRQESFEEKQRRAGAWICLRDIPEWRSELHASVCIEKPQICDQVVFVVILALRMCLMAGGLTARRE